MFILSKTPDQVSESDPVDSELQHMLHKALLTVAAKVVPVQFSNTFPITFLTPLLNKLHSPDSDVRLLKNFPDADSDVKCNDFSCRFLCSLQGFAGFYRFLASFKSLEN